MRKLFLLCGIFLVTTAHAAVVTSVSDGGLKYHFSDMNIVYRSTIKDGMITLTSGVEGDTWEHDGQITCSWIEYSWGTKDGDLIQYKKSGVFKTSDYREKSINVYDGEKLIVTINVN